MARLAPLCLLAVCAVPSLSRAADPAAPASASASVALPPASVASGPTGAPSAAPTPTVAAAPPAASVPSPVVDAPPPAPGVPPTASGIERTSLKWYRRRQNPGIHARYGWSVPDYLLFQTGGYQGMFTVGLGYSFFHDVLHADMRFGYTPYYRGAPAVRNGSLLVSIRPLRLDMGKEQTYLWHPLYAGGGVMLISSEVTFRTQPSIYPKGYYPANGVQFLALLGTEFAFRTDGTGTIRRHGVYAEAVVVNQYLGAILKNRDLPLLDAFSASFGYRMSL